MSVQTNVARVFVVFFCFAISANAKDPPDLEFGKTTEPVGPSAEANQFTTPDNHRLAPAGKLIDLPGARPQGVALSPDGRLLVVGGGKYLTVIDPTKGEIIERIPVPAEQDKVPDAVSERILTPAKYGQLGFTGLIFAPDGKHVYMSNVVGNICVFRVNEQNQVRIEVTIPLPATGNTQRTAEIPSGLAISKDGTKLYACLNMTNQLAEIDTTSRKILRRWETGMVPYDVVLAGGKAYVSNWAGRHPDSKSTTANGGRGVAIRVDPTTGAAADGTVSVIDLANNDKQTDNTKKLAAKKELVTGLHASGLAVSPDGKYVCVANAASDTISVIETAKDEVVEKFWPKKTPADLFGAAPNALAFSPDGDFLYACNGTQNAVAIIEFKPGHCELEGLIPTAWYPGAIVFDKKNQQICVANIKGYGGGNAHDVDAAAGKTGSKFTSKQSQGCLSLIPVPKNKDERTNHTNTVLRTYRAPLIELALAKPREGVSPRPVPERVGEPSVFKHVVYIIKENRTYDQVLGDLPQGAGDPSLCIYGEKVTPNQHKLARDYVLLDNTYCSGVLSADGHNWACSAITTDYLEKSFAGFPRSYPDGGDAKNGSDALAWSPAGFIWDAALAKKKSIRIFGEFADTSIKWSPAAIAAGRKGKPSWSHIYSDFTAKKDEVLIEATPLVEAIRPYLSPRYPSWGNQVTDQIRSSIFLEELAGWEKSGNMPNLMVLSLPIDHTNGTTAGYPVPNSQVADNDLALAKIIEGVSKSRFWAETCFFIIEDDPQDGWDHISGYRTTAFVVSPYTKRKTVISTQYNQTSLLRTIELILGLPPMNELDATATPMFDCFQDQPDTSRYIAVESNIPLDKLNQNTAEITEPTQKRFAIQSEELNFEKLDACPEDTLNRILWHSARGDEPYPVWAVRNEDD